MDKITPENRNCPCWTIEKGAPFYTNAVTHPTLKFNLGVDLVHGADVAKLKRLRRVSWKIESALRNILPNGIFNSREDVHSVYETTGVGLTLKEYELLPTAKQVVLKNSKISRRLYDSVRDMCTSVEANLLQKIKNAGNLADAYVWIGGMGSPEELSFYDQDGFYLRPPILFNFLCDENGVAVRKRLG